MAIHANNVTGSSTSTGSFGHILKGGVNWRAAVSESLSNVGFGSGGGSGFDYTSGSSPVVSTNPSSIGATWINTTSGEIFVATDITTGENNWLGTAGTEVVPDSAAYFGSRGLWIGGLYASSYTSYSNTIDYVTIATTGNAIDFGDLTVSRFGVGACSDGTKGVWAGGTRNASVDNILDYITIATTGNASDFGDLTVSRWGAAGCSGN